MKKTYIRAGIITLSFLAVAGSAALHAATAESGAAHGALDVATQEQRLDALRPANTGVPTGVDPVAWATSMSRLTTNSRPTASRSVASFISTRACHVTGRCHAQRATT
jgi:hypothetical protein